MAIHTGWEHHFQYPQQIMVSYVPLFCRKNREKFSIYNGSFSHVPVMYVPVITQGVLNAEEWWYNDKMFL